MKIIGRVKLKKNLYVCNYSPDHPSPCLACAEVYFDMCGGASIKQASRITSLSKSDRNMMLPEKIGKRHLILSRKPGGAVGTISVPHIPFPSCKKCKGKGILWQNTKRTRPVTGHKLFEGFIGQNNLALGHGAALGGFAAVSFFSPEYNNVGCDALDYAFGSSGEAMAALDTAWYEALERIYVFSKPQNAFSQKSTCEGLKRSFPSVDPRIWGKKHCTYDHSDGILRGSFSDIKEKLRWYEGKDLKGRSFFIPEHLLFCNTWESNAKLYLASSGCATFSSLWESRLRAALEIIERDCSLRSWVTGYPGYAVKSWKSYDGELNALNRNCRSLGLTATIRDLSDVPGVSVIIALLVNKNGIWPACSVGTSAKSFQPAAIKAALYEASLNYVLQKRRGQDHMNLPSAFSGQIHTHPVIHNHFYGQHENLRHLNFWLSGTGGQKINATDYLQNRSKASIVKYLNSSGKRLYFYSLEPKFLRLKKYFVSRCISPDVAELIFQIGAFKMPVTLATSAMRPEVFKIPHPFC